MPDWNWQRAAACRGEDLVLFFGPDGERPPQKDVRERKAKAICAQCPARTACLEYALSRPEKYGLYGGLTEDERASERRRQMRRQVSIPAPRKPVTAKECPSCRSVKPAAAYGRDQSRPDGLHSACKECTNQAQFRRRTGVA